MFMTSVHTSLFLRTFALDTVVSYRTCTCVGSIAEARAVGAVDAGRGETGVEFWTRNQGTHYGYRHYIYVRASNILTQ